MMGSRLDLVSGSWGFGFVGGGICEEGWVVPLWWVLCLDVAWVVRVCGMIDERRLIGGFGEDVAGLRGSLCFFWFFFL